MNTIYADGTDDVPVTVAGGNDGLLDRAGYRSGAAVIKASTLGKELDRSECELLAKVMEVRHLAAGERLVTEGETDNRLVLVATGKVAVLSTAGGRETNVYTMTRGECAGTRAFVDGTPRKATLEAVDDASVYLLAPEVFEEFILTQPMMAYKVMRSLFRITHTNLMRVNQECLQLSNYISRSGGRY